ncbi:MULTISPECIES: LysR family transcriptional regulator [unclassified Acidithiobacillus]|uniref:LysR family transcriptional regulator n=1 Tax=unclassified Acidithiobacillus TaxID=2614800 RepID=UPI001D0D2A6A|nr:MULTISPECIES: LysR family transcriptional regulator [unclassified Acidithiobacillus]
MSLELRHLRYFIAVAEELHFSRAAERLGISQPPLSHQIHTLEEMLGARLFVRTNRRVALTDAGEAFLKEARAILVQVDRAVDYVRSVERGEKGELNIGMTCSTMLAEQVPRAIFQFRTQFPSVHLNLEELNSLEQIEALIHGKIQVGIMRVQHLPAMLQSHMLYAHPIKAVTSRCPDVFLCPHVCYPFHGRSARPCSIGGRRSNNQPYGQNAWQAEGI